MTWTVLSVAFPFAPVGPDAVGGAEQVLSHLDRALVTADHRSIVVAREDSVVTGTLQPVPVVQGPIDDAARRRAWAAHRRAIAAALDRWPVDLVHLHGIDFAAYMPESGPTLATLHLPPAWYPPEAWRARPGLFLNAVSPSQDAACPPVSHRLRPIPNGVPIDTLAARHARRAFVLSLGRICPEKGAHEAIEAAKRADVQFILAGQVFDYPEHRRYFDEVVRPALDARRRFVGPLGFRRKRRFLNAARGLLVPSLAPETSSLVAMEALACGTPVIAYPNGALADIVEHGRTGYLVESAAAMAEAIGHLDRIDRNLCRETARRRFSLETMVAGYFDAYRTVIVAAVPVAAP